MKTPKGETTDIVLAPRVRASHKLRSVAQPPKQAAEPWERQPGDTPKSFRAFRVYRDLGEDRTLAKATEKMGRPPGYVGTLERWSSAGHWVARCLAWDDRQDELTRSRLERQQLRLAGRRLAVAGKMLDVAEEGYDALLEQPEGEEKVVVSPLTAARIAEAAAKVGGAGGSGPGGGPAVNIERLLMQVAAHQEPGSLTD